MRMPETKKLRGNKPSDKELLIFLDIDKDALKRIRQGSRRKRLFSAGKWLSNKYKDATGDLVAWLAGYASESIVRTEFGSTTLFKRKLFGHIQSDWNGRVTFSDKDIRRRVNIPIDMDENIAEETGIHIGDGNLYRYGSKTSYKISGNLKEDYEYYGRYTANLLHCIYGIYPRHEINITKNEYVLILQSKGIASFKHNVLGLPFGNKKHILIPSQITNKTDLLSSCVRGIVDTDFYVSDKLRGTFYSPELVRQLKDSFQRLGFHPSCFSFSQKYNERLYNAYAIVVPKYELGKYQKEIGFHNIKHESKLEILDEYSFIPVYTTTKERLAVLKGKMDFNELYQLSLKRRKRPGEEFH